MYSGISLERFYKVFVLYFSSILFSMLHSIFSSVILSDIRLFILSILSVYPTGGDGRAQLCWAGVHLVILSFMYSFILSVHPTSLPFILSFS